MSSLLCMQGRFPGGSASIVKWARRQSRTVEEYDFTFFSFSACLKAGGWCRSTRYWTGASPTSAFKSAIDICDWSTTFACVHPLPWRSDNDSQHVFWRFDPASSAARLLFLFFFFFHCRSHNESGSNPLPPIWKFFRLSAMCEILRWPLTLKIRNFEWKTGTCVRSVTSESKSTLIMPASHSDISVDLQGSLTAQKRACMLLSIYYLMVKSCNTFGVATSPNVADLFTSFNGMNLNKWSCPWSSFGIVFVGFQEH